MTHHRKSTVRAVLDVERDLSIEEECWKCEEEREQERIKQRRREMIESGEIDEKMEEINELMHQLSLKHEDVNHNARRQGVKIITRWDEPYSKPQYAEWDILKAEKLIEDLKWHLNQ
jgi:uncharacterized protein YbcI